MDKFQGRDADAVIFSTAKSHWRLDDAFAAATDGAGAGGGREGGGGGGREGGGGGGGQAGDLLRDWRRVNVAVTRARRKLIVVGSERVLSQVHPI